MAATQCYVLSLYVCACVIMFAKMVFLVSLFFVVYISLVLFRFDRDWKKIEAYVGSKTVIQVKLKFSLYFFLSKFWLCILKGKRQEDLGE